MIASPDRIVSHGVTAARIEGARWRYASLAPWPQTTPAGDPLISLIEAGGFALAQLSVQLDPPAAELEALRTVLRGDDEGAAPVILEPAVSAVTDIRIIAQPGGDERVLATSRGSGFPPYTAAFSLPLAGRDLEVVKGALSGTERLIDVRFTVHVDGTETIRSSDLAAWVRGEESPQEDQPC
ncbi:MAG TPA: hypothetical protein VFY91_10910 [Microbacterium sp.]|nr:hypothetical protein [Microbacterium sp.]